MTRIIVILFVLLLCSDADAQLFRRFERSSPRPTASSGRYCNSPTCQMCNRLFGLMPGYAYVNGRVTYVGFATTPDKPTKTDPMAAASAPTPQVVVEYTLIHARLKPDDVLLDPGCGDGRFLVTAAQRYGCRCVGIEIDPETAEAAEANVAAAGVADRVTIIRGDARKIRVSGVTVVVLYMFPKDIEAMQPNWPNARVFSYLHQIPGVPNQSLRLSLEGQEHVVYFWTKGP